MDPLDEANDDTAAPMDILIDAGAKAMLAALTGDHEEEQRQLKRGRAAYKEVRDAQILLMFDQAEADFQRRRSKSAQKRKKKRERQTPGVTTNLGDLLKNAGVTAKDEED